MFTAEEVAKLKELEILNPPNAPGHLLLFPPLVYSSWGKVVSTALGAPPPDLDTHGIGQALVTDRDEESVLSNSYPTINPTPLTAAPCGGGKSGGAQKGDRNHRPKSARTEMATSLVTRTATEITTGNMIDPKRAITDMVQIGLMDALQNTKDMMANATVMASVRDCAGMRFHLTATKQSRDAE